MSREWLKKERLKNFMTQSALGAAIGLSESGYNRLENGNRKLTTDQVVKLAKIFGMNAEDILRMEVDYGTRAGNASA